MTTGKSIPKLGFTRRGLLALLAAVVSLPRRIGQAQAAPQEPRSPAAGTQVDRWHQTHDRVWLGESFWANPMEDWRVVDGAAEVQTSGGDRNVHLITHRLTGERGRFRMSVRCRRVEAGERDGGVGFRIGVRNLIDDHRSNCFARDVGVDAGFVGGRLVLGGSRAAVEGGDAVAADGVALVLEGRTEGEEAALSLTARTTTGAELGTVRHTLPAADIEGNVAIVSNFDGEIPKGEGARYRFSEWTVDGDAFEVDEDRRFGPILWSMYSLSDSRTDEGFVVKLTALMSPLGEDDEPARRTAHGARRGLAIPWLRAARPGRLDGDVPAATVERAGGGAVPARLPGAPHGRWRDGVGVARVDPG